MNACLNSQNALAYLIERVQKRPSIIASPRAFIPHDDVISKNYQGNHQNWNNGGFTNHH